mmetsp:Transcript_118928/g.296757  ORF Transcript_118928/g.296757 Transcript_118928/m.296757 type:complete len:435 (-) Transcript_118928:274-1578(-)|eukprot:CAMPEP_0115253530 /NCGR_PEP_ID=MMETSP0270-20121206/44718_1 /TAXON_ID=71861 /ORGANISM="Scrippsiella trochoidea, Strain CCMP3099" /LENGTH=434 /DNA_ID=CAMNT_0002669035 /DNA_START=47 /DNA_END=1351 /DNA_ORIENTATION=+
MPPKLTGIRTWVRIRPLGDLGHADGERVEKQLGDFDEKEIKIISHDQGSKVMAYDYPSKVFPVDCTQEDVSAEVLPDLLEDFWNERSVMIFAYGQTGTGKTTTMFGFPESLTSESVDPGWGLLPRAVHATLEHNAAQAKAGVQSVLLLSAIEFYAFMAFDLADKAGKQMCTFRGSQVVGNTYMKCDSPAILKEFLERVYSNRKVVATRMNEGSSRSHCVIILTLMTLNESTQSFKQTSFAIVDLAGAERPEKALGERMTKDQAMLEMVKYMRTPSADMSPGLQGFIINFELHSLLSEVVAATIAHKAGRRYVATWRGAGASAYFGGALSGEARLACLICLSQSPQNGWETWFSIAQYGRQIAELKTRLIKNPAVPMKTAVKEAEKAAADAAEDLAKAGTSASNMKYQPFRVGMKVYTEQRLHYIQQLNAMGGTA